MSTLDLGLSLCPAIDPRVPFADRTPFAGTDRLQDRPRSGSPSNTPTVRKRRRVCLADSRSSGTASRRRRTSSRGEIGSRLSPIVMSSSCLTWIRAGHLRRRNHEPVLGSSPRQTASFRRVRRKPYGGRVADRPGGFADPGTVLHRFAAGWRRMRGGRRDLSVFDHRSAQVKIDGIAAGNAGRAESGSAMLWIGAALTGAGLALAVGLRLVGGARTAGRVIDYRARYGDPAVHRKRLGAGLADRA